MVEIKLKVFLDATQTGKKMVLRPEIRVWCHSLDGGDDYYYVFPSFIDAERFIRINHAILRLKGKPRINERAESFPLLAFRGYEIHLYGLKPFYSGITKRKTLKSATKKS